MAERLVPALREQLRRCREVYEGDVKAGFAGAFAPETGSERKWKSRMKEWPWQFLFPQENLTRVEGTKGGDEWRRYHFHDKVFGQRLKAAVGMTGIHKRVTAHTFRHSFASHLLLRGYDIRSIDSRAPLARSPLRGMSLSLLSKTPTSLRRFSGGAGA